ncbi:uncharacterized protein LOC104872400 isoform X2 [Fukomys damarensis]|uniref:uncharacterized protein LOC104872400 isoform X2 n=1 Tax=Fukomys damarensis TaxID=885580 RepID=UPI00053F5258|nr:uncharacterized protein LOC104872400 isoform X2 [Fukomys damarensis]
MLVTSDAGGSRWRRTSRNTPLGVVRQALGNQRAEPRETVGRSLQRKDRTARARWLRTRGLGSGGLKGARWVPMDDGWRLYCASCQMLPRVVFRSLSNAPKVHPRFPCGETDIWKA